MANNDIGGHWVTIAGRRVFIKDGQTKSDAMKESGKFKKQTKLEKELQKKSDEWWNNLSEDEKRHIERYTGGLNRDINNYLSNGEDAIPSYMVKSVKETIKEIDKSMDSFKLNKDITTYRRTDASRVFGKDFNIDKFKIEDYKNALLQNDGYISTSLSEEISQKAFKGNVFITFKVPKETKGIYIGKHSLINYEQEYLMARGTNYTINDIEMKNDMIYILAEVKK